MDYQAAAVASHLRALMDDRGIESQRQLATMARVSPNTINRIFDLYPVRATTLVQLASALGVPPEQLLTAAGFIDDDAPALSLEAAKALGLFEMLDSKRKNDALEYLRFLYRRQETEID